MADLDTLQARLTEAEEAYHKLMTGAREVMVGDGDSRVTYAEADADRLAVYVRDLRQQISVAGGATVVRRAHARF